jgi:sucrose phosphorylase
MVTDVIVNHISDRSRPVRDVVERGQESPYAGMLLTYDRVFPAGAIEDDLTRIVRPRPGLPFTPLVLGGRRRLLWTTFTSQQIDLDVQHPAARRYLSQVLHRLADSGVAMVRLDAVGYAVKTAGSSCFLTPETMRFVAALTAEARRLGMEVLAEVHAHRRYATETATQVDRVYDFVLAPLILHGLFTGDSAPLHRWLLDRPGNCVTVLETHDGIGLLDTGPGPRPGDAGRTRAPSWARRCGSPSFRRCCGSSACATPIRPSAVPSPFPPSRRASCAWRGTPTAHGPNCGRGWPTPPTG